MKKYLVLTIVSLFFLVLTVSAQTNQFSFQGSLNNAGLPANGNYDFEFVLYDALNAGNQVGQIVQRNNLVISNGIFSVQLDFGNSFPGALRFLEIRVRPAGQQGITILAPRQLIDSSPYSIKSLNSDTASNALSLGGVSANQYVVTTDPRMSDARQPIGGSADYVQNRVTQQAATDFHISGTGTAGGTLSASTVNANTNTTSPELASSGRVARIFLSVPMSAQVIQEAVIRSSANPREPVILPVLVTRFSGQRPARKIRAASGILSWDEPPGEPTLQAMTTRSSASIRV